MILYIEGPKMTPEPLRITKQLLKCSRYLINLPKSLAYVYANNEHDEKELWKTVSFSAAPRKIKHLGINITKEVKDLYQRSERL